MNRTENFTDTTLMAASSGGYFIRDIWSFLQQVESMSSCLAALKHATDNRTAIGSCSPPTASARPKASAATN